MGHRSRSLCALSSLQSLALAFTASIACALVIVLTSLRVSAAADVISGPDGQALTTTNIALKNALAAYRNEHEAAAQSGASSSSGPTGTSTVAATKNRGLPTGLSYTLDFSVSVPFGNLGTQTAWLPGGMDAVLGYGWSPNFRAAISFYQIQHYPCCFNSGTIPLYLQGLAPPLGTVNLANANINATNKDSFLFIQASGLLKLGQVPIVVSPLYVSRWGLVGKSSNGVVPFMYNGFPVYGVEARTAQYWAGALTLPFLSSPRMFGTFTIAPTWLTHLNGVNIENHAQLYQVMYLEYKINDKSRIFFQPQVSRDYLPPDPYAEHNAGYFVGASYHVYKQAFVQAIFSATSPTNYSPYGVYALTCQALPCSQNPVIPTVGGLKDTQLQIQFGVGTPSVIPL